MPDAVDAHPQTPLASARTTGTATPHVAELMPTQTKGKGGLEDNHLTDLAKDNHRLDQDA